MSIADKLTYLNETKRQLREAINAAGGNLTQETPFREYVGGWLRDQGASLILDFSKQQFVAKDQGTMFPDRVGFEDIVDFTRSTGGGRFNAQGQYEWVEADVPRIDYDPVTGECLGLLVEEQRTNLIPNSEDVTSLVASNADVQPDSSGAFKLAATTDGGAYLRSGYLAGANNAHVNSIDIKAGSYKYARLSRSHVSSNVGVMINLETGEAVTAGSADRPFTVRRLGGGWYRISLMDKDYSYPSLALYLTSYAGIDDAGYSREGYRPSAGEYIYVRRPQVELGTFPTSYIPTNGSAVTRAADNAVIDLSDEFNPNEGTFFFEFKAYVGGGGHQYVNFNNTFRFYESATPNRVEINWGGGVSDTVRSGVPSGHYSFKIALTYTGQQARLALLFGDEVLAFSAETEFQLHNTLYLFNRPQGDRAADGTFKTVEYFPRALTESELQEITTQ